MIKPLAIALVISGALSACSIGNINNHPALEEINSLADARAKVRNGMSMAQVEQAIGSPSNRSVQNRTTTWFYGTSRKNISGRGVIVAGLGGYISSTSRAVIIQFNESGRVADVSYNEVTL